MVSLRSGGNERSMMRHVERWADMFVAAELLILRLTAFLSLLWAIVKFVRSEW